MVGNFGLTLPTGSDQIAIKQPTDGLLLGKPRIRIFLLSFLLLYLFEGTGNPCAGHIKAWLPLTALLNPRTSSVEGIFGRTLPTGSK